MIKLVEIEQKFLYEKIPYEEFKLEQHTVIYRKYLAVDPEVRINKRCFDNGEERYHLTVKSNGQLIRKEIKIKISKEQYEALSSMKDKENIVLDIYEFRLDEHHSICFKEGRNIDIQFAEIEYETMEDKERFAKRLEQFTFLTKEVTFDERYYMKNIWEEFHG